MHSSSRPDDTELIMFSDAVGMRINLLPVALILTSSLSVYWKRPPGQLLMTRMKMVQNDLDSHRLSWTEAVDLAQNRPLWRLLATSGTMHS